MILVSNKVVGGAYVSMLHTYRHKFFKSAIGATVGDAGAHPWPPQVEISTMTESQTMTYQGTVVNICWGKCTQQFKENRGLDKFY